MALRCPNCGSDKYKVVDSRQSADKPAIRRRRQCLECDFLFSTNETYVRKIYVMDQKGNSQPYSTYRLKLSLVDATRQQYLYPASYQHLEEEIAYVPKKIYSIQLYCGTCYGLFKAARLESVCSLRD